MSLNEVYVDGKKLIARYYSCIECQNVARIPAGEKKPRQCPSCGFDGKKFNKLPILKLKDK